MSEGSSESVAKSTCVETSALMGRFDHALDPKKRLTIPSEWRRAMGDPEYVFVMPDAKEQCLNLIPRDVMEARLEEFRRKAIFDPSLNQVLQVIGANSQQLLLDCQGRIRIGDKLLQFANLTTTVAMVGAVRTIKLWNPAVLPPENEVDQNALAAAIAAIGF